MSGSDAIPHDQQRFTDVFEQRAEEFDDLGGADRTVEEPEVETHNQEGEAEAQTETAVAEAPTLEQQLAAAGDRQLLRPRLVRQPEHDPGQLLDELAMMLRVHAGTFLAFAACWIAYRQEAHEGAKHESPVILMTVMFLASLFLFAQKASADTFGTDPCIHLEPWSWYWVLIGCMFHV